MSETITKLSGTNNNFNVVIPFRRLNKYKKVKLRSTFYLLAGNYDDFTDNNVVYFKDACEVRVSLPSTNHDTNEVSKYQLTLGLAERLFVGTDEAVLKYSMADSIEHVIDFPTDETINISILAVNEQKNGSQFFTTTSGTDDGTDATNSILILQLEGIDENI